MKATINPRDPDLLWALISYLLQSWEGALHSRDSAIQVAQKVEDWKALYEAALADPFRIQHTRNQFSVARKLFDALHENQASDSLLEQLVEEVKKIPN